MWVSNFTNNHNMDYIVNIIKNVNVNYIKKSELDGSELMGGIDHFLVGCNHSLTVNTLEVAQREATVPSRYQANHTIVFKFL